MISKELIIPTDEYERYCTGASISGLNRDYVAVVGVTCAAVKRQLTETLDEINAYDTMENDRHLNIGQVNMLNVSSFCRARNAIWGLEIARVKLKELFKLNGIPVYNGMPLHRAGRSLFRRYPIAPGDPVFFAAKDHYGEPGERIYAALAIGLPPEYDKRNAKLFMEDKGTLTKENFQLEMNGNLEKLALSVIGVGNNQKVSYEKIIVLSDTLKVPEGCVGGSMPAVAYVRLAKKAVPKDKSLEDMSLSDWIDFQDKPISIDFSHLRHPDAPMPRWKPLAWDLEWRVH